MNKIRPEMVNHPMAISARETNSYAEKHGIEETCEHYNLNVEDVRYMAEQRALRVIYARRGINLNMKTHEILSLTLEEANLQLSLMMAYMDGLVIGWRAREIQAEKDGETK